jgi:hypothetical protein
VPADDSNQVVIVEEHADGTSVLTVEGVFDGSTYLPLRDAIIKAAIDNAGAVVIDVTELTVPVPSAWAVFTSARWHLGQWPQVPVVLVCSSSSGREALVRNAVARYVPVYPTRAEAVTALATSGNPGIRRRARTELPRGLASVARSRELAAEWLAAWSRPDLISVTKLIVTVLIENVLVHTHSAPVLRLECKGDLVTVAVEDESAEPAVRRELPTHGVDDVSGLAIVAALCREWGNSPSPTGKSVWAVIGPENRL